MKKYWISCKKLIIEWQVYRMNLVTTMSKLKKVVKLNIYEDEMEQSDKKYMVYNVVSEYGDDYVDDMPQNESCKFYLHLFLPKNESYRTYKRDIKKFLLDNEISFLQGPTQIETKLRHLVFECVLKGEYSYD